MCLIHYKNDTITFWITYWLYQWRKRKNVSFVILQTLWKCYFWKFSEHSEKSATFKNVRQTPNWNIWEKYIPWKMYKWCLGHPENVLEEGCWKACHDALRKFPVRCKDSKWLRPTLCWPAGKVSPECITSSHTHRWALVSCLGSRL